MANKKTLLIDVDGVLRNIMGKCCEIYKRDFDPLSMVSHSHIVEWDFDPVFPRLPKAHRVFFSEYAEELFMDAEPYEIEVAEKLAQIREGNELIIATDQLNGNGKYTLQWLESYRIPYDGIFISPHKTLLKGDIALDDRIQNLENYREAGILPVCMERPWNTGRWDGEIVHNLHEFYLLLQDMKRN